MNMIGCLQDMVKEKEDRVEELAEALKESVTITADREMLLAQQTETISKLKKQVTTSLKGILQMNFII